MAAVADVPDIPKARLVGQDCRVEISSAIDFAYGAFRRTGSGIIEPGMPAVTADRNIVTEPAQPRIERKDVPWLVTEKILERQATPRHAVVGVQVGLDRVALGVGQGAYPHLKALRIALQYSQRFFDEPVPVEFPVVLHVEYVRGSHP